MNTVLPIAIIVALGTAAGFVCHRRWHGLWIASLAAAFAATATWVGGASLFIWLSAPRELGSPLAAPVLAAFVTALVPALLIGLSTRRLRV